IAFSIDLSSKSLDLSARSFGYIFRLTDLRSAIAALQWRLQRLWGMTRSLTLRPLGSGSHSVYGTAETQLNRIRKVFVFRFFEGSRSNVLAWAGICIAAIALVDWRLEVNISFGFLYLLPMLMLGGSLTLAQIAGVAALCTGLTEAFDPFPWAT